MGGPDRIASTTRLALWCFSPGVAMQALVAEGTRNLVLTSGTLAPLSSFSYELRVPFDVTLENEHVIEGSQVREGVCVAVVVVIDGGVARECCCNGGD